jgi:LSD1 subclass zinc finger protein
VALKYCSICGVLIPDAPPEQDAVICEKCFTSRKVTVAGNQRAEASAAANQEPRPPSRIQFSCPSCRSLLQLPPVEKRTKIKCPRCQVDFHMYPDGRIEASSPSPVAPQAKLLEDLRPISDLNALLEKVPERKVTALPSVLDSDLYGKPAEESSNAAARPAAPPPAKRAAEPIYELLPESESESGSTGVAFAKNVIEQAPEQPKKVKTTAKRPREAVGQARREREQREIRAAEAQRHTLALLERRNKRVLAAAKLVALVVAPLLVSGVFLVSTTNEAGFAVKGTLGARLADLGEVVRRGVEGMRALVGG